jgi:predicted regulator of Ras-like GTPase activity (Roadblock/LC7/MglB family)
MVFQSLLKELVTSVEGAVGAIILDWEGEPVEWWDSENKDRLMLRAAYVDVAFKMTKKLVSPARAGRASRLMIEYENARFVVEEIAHGYVVVIELGLSGNIAEALRETETAVGELRREVE